MKLTIMGVLHHRKYRFGVGRLVRELNLTLVENYYTPRIAAASVPAELSVVSWPARPMRGIQIGYRPKTNSCVTTVRDSCKYIISMHFHDGVRSMKNKT